MIKVSVLNTRFGRTSTLKCQNMEEKYQTKGGWVGVRREGGGVGGTLRLRRTERGRTVERRRLGRKAKQVTAATSRKRRCYDNLLRN